MMPRRPSPGSTRPLRGPIGIVFLTFLLVVGGAMAGCLDAFQSAGQPGGWALDYLRDDKYKELVVEIDHESGAGPSDRTLGMLQDTLGARLNKPGGITFDTSAEVDGKGSGAKYSFSEIRDLEGDHRDHKKSGDRAVLYIIFLDGGSTEDTADGRVLGAVYSGSSMVMFKDNIRHTHDRCRSNFLNLNCPSQSKIEDAVVTHELGHVLGLVNLNPDDVPMQHEREDPESEGHSKYEDSVMYFAVRTSGGILDLLGNRSLPTEFDQYDIQDLRNAGGK